MVAQTTDSGSSNPIIAQELQSMFRECDDPVFWDSSRNQIRCYCHKFALTGKARLGTIGLGNHGRTNPTVPSGNRLRLLLPDDHLPPPKIVMVDGKVYDEDGEVPDETDSKLDSQGGEVGKDVEASDDSEDEDKAPDYKIQKPDAAPLP